MAVTQRVGVCACLQETGVYELNCLVRVDEFGFFVYWKSDGKVSSLSPIICPTFLCRITVNNNNNNNNLIYKAPKALASESLAVGQSWVLIKSLTEEVYAMARMSRLVTMTLLSARA